MITINYLNEFYDISYSDNFNIQYLNEEFSVVM